MLLIYIHFFQALVFKWHINALSLYCDYFFPLGKQKRSPPLFFVLQAFALRKKIKQTVRKYLDKISGLPAGATVTNVLYLNFFLDPFL